MEHPYHIKKIVKEIRVYNSLFGDNRICECGHPYFRHFDSYDDMVDAGCKYCSCFTFRLATNNDIGKGR